MRKREDDAVSGDGKGRMLEQFLTFLYVTLWVNGAGCFFQQADTEARMERVQNAVIDTVVSGEACDINICHAMRTQVGGELGIVTVAVIVEGAVTVSVYIHAFAEDGSNAPGVKRRM